MMMFVVRGARYGLRGVRVGEASHPGPPLRRLRRVSSTHQDRGVDDIDPTTRDSDDDAPLVRTQFAEVARCPPITVGGRFAVSAGSSDCEEFDLTIADGPEELDPVALTAQDTVTDVASTVVDRHNSPSTSLLDALDRDLAREDAEFEVGVVVDIAAESDSDAVSHVGDGIAEDPGPRDVVEIHVTPAIREGFLDEIDLVPIFKRRACIMNAPPTFLKGAYRSAMRLQCQRLRPVTE